MTFWIWMSLRCLFTHSRPEGFLRCSAQQPWAQAGGTGMGTGIGTGRGAGHVAL